MKKAKILLLAAAYLFLLFLSVCPGTDTARTAAPATLSPTEAGADSGRIPKAYIRAKGKQFVVGEDDTPIRLEGVCFGNEVWGNPLLPPTKHHNERDFLRVKEMKMNVIRFYLNYGLFEDDEEPYQYVEYGWEWLDKNVEWAKKHGIYLIFNMHVPQGGFQSHGEGMALWDDPEIQNRLVA
ncbi:MAG: cellulase family glycosylhydrolase, partial [Firmicutes bacterium]|nr:cellulase family glycosylhydrolase [Bacillota bacterium]